MPSRWYKGFTWVEELMDEETLRLREMRMRRSLVDFLRAKGSNPARPKHMVPTPVRVMIEEIPKVGMRKKPVARLPTILPAVDQKKMRPEWEPIPLLGFWSDANLTAKGERRPKRTLGMKKRSSELISGPVDKGKIRPNLGRKKL